MWPVMARIDRIKKRVSLAFVRLLLRLGLLADKWDDE